MPQPFKPFPLGTDSVLLADFAVLPPRASVFDLGAGAGTLGLLLCEHRGDCTVDGVELQPEAAAAAAAAIAERGLAARLSVAQGDLRTFSAGRHYDVVLSNPPYFPVGSGAVSASQAAARTELTCTLGDVCAAAARLLRWGGVFYLVHRPERLCDIVTCLRAQRLEPKRLRLVRHRAGSPPCFLLIESRLGSAPGLRYEPELLLEENGAPSAEYTRIYGGTSE